LTVGAITQSRRIDAQHNARVGSIISVDRARVSAVARHGGRPCLNQWSTTAAGMFLGLHMEAQERRRRGPPR